MGGADLAAALRLFAVPEADRSSVLEAHELVCRDPAAAAWVQRVAAGLRAALGRPSPGPLLPPRPPDALSALPTQEPPEPQEPPESRHPGWDSLPVVALAEVVPDLLAHHESLGVPAAVTADTLADVGRMLARNRVWFGEAGLGDELAGWLTRHLHGALFEVGRLQFERIRLGDSLSAALSAAGLSCALGDLALNLHIPEAGGALSGATVNASLGAARDAFAAWFPDESPVALVCTSWLLDPQLLGVLPATSNLAAFQRRFTLTQDLEPGEDSMRRFVLRDLTTPREALTAESSLGRAVLAHWRDGGEWHVRHGWLPWP